VTFDRLASAKPCPFGVAVANLRGCRVGIRQGLLGVPAVQALVGSLVDVAGSFIGEVTFTEAIMFRERVGQRHGRGSGAGRVDVYGARSMPRC
jgi:hypothetical protein